MDERGSVGGGGGGVVEAVDVDSGWMVRVVESKVRV